MKRRLAMACLLILLIVTSLLLLVPVISQVFVDYGHPIEAKLVKKEEGGIEVVIEYPDGVKEAMINFYDLLGSPVKPSLLILGISSFVLGVIFLFGMDHFSYSSREVLRNLAKTVLPIQCLLWICFIVLGIFNARLFDVIDTLKEGIENQGIARVAIDRYNNRQLFLMWLPLLIFGVADIVVFFVTATIEGVFCICKEFIEKGLRKFIDFDLDEDVIILRNTGRVELSRVSAGVNWRPLPVICLRREVIKSVSPDFFFNCLIGDSKEIAFSELRKELVGSYESSFNGVGITVSARLVGDICSVLERRLKVITAEIQQEKKPSLERAQHLLQETSDGSLARFQQELVAGVRAAIDESIGGFKQEILDRLRDRIIGSGVFDPNYGDAVFPEGTRFFLSRGDMSVFVVEQKPQKRTIRFSQDAECLEIKEGSYHLFFPYIIFLVVLRGGCLSRFQIFYCKEPLHTLDDSLYQVNLPNIGDEGVVCLGMNTTRASVAAEAVNEAISHFWQSNFNSDINHAYMRTRRETGLDVKEWQRKTREDPSFVFQHDWTPSCVSLREIIKILYKESLGMRRVMLDNFIQEVSQREEETVGQVVHDFCQGITIDDRYSRTLAKELSSCLATLGENLSERMRNSFGKEIVGEIDGETLRQFQKEVIETIAQILENEFQQLTGRVLIRRRVDNRTLVRDIREGR